MSIIYKEAQKGSLPVSDNELQMNVTEDIVKRLAMNTTESAMDRLMMRIAVFLADPLFKHISNIYYAIPWINLVIGLPGSVVSFLVIMRMKPFTSASFYYCVLAVADGFFVSFVLFIVYGSKISVKAMEIICPIAEGIWEILTLFPNFILIVLAGERCTAVWFPLKVGLFTSVNKAIACSIGCLLIVLALTVHNFALWRMTEDTLCSMAGIEGFSEFYTKVWSKVMPFLYSVVPCILIILLNVIIISGLSRSNRIRRHITEGDEKLNKETETQTRQVTMMLVSISLLFLVTNLPYAIFHVFGDIGGWDVFKGDDIERLFTSEHVKYSLMLTFFTMLRDLNHSLNFICYFVTTRRFREELKNLACDYSKRAKGSSKKTLTSSWMGTSKTSRVTSDTCMSDLTGSYP